MSPPQPTPLVPDCPRSVGHLRHQLHQRLDQIIDTCLGEQAGSSFLAFEAALLALLRPLGQLLLQLFLLVRHRRLDLDPWLRGDRYRCADDYAPRTLQTSCGPVTYGRAYLIGKRGHGPGVHPLDAELGLTRDSFSPLLIGWFCRLATRLTSLLQIPTPYAVA